MEQAKSIIKTLDTFAKACNLALETALVTNKSRAFDIHHACYHRIKAETELTANYVVRAIARVAQSFGTNKKNPKSFKPTSADLDKDLFRYNPILETISLASMDGRLKNVRLSLGDYQRNLLQNQTPKAGQLIYNKKRDRFYIGFVIEEAEPTPTGTNSLGVDRGIIRIVGASDGYLVSGRNINRTRERYARTRASLQAKGTKNARRVLKRLSGKQRRFMRDINHAISKELVNRAVNQNAYIVLEDLEGIRERTKKQGKRLRRMIGGWSFYQLQTMLEYKGKLQGVKTIYVNAAYTSKTCNVCGQIGSRKKHIFKCSCGNIDDAEINAAKNIALRGAQVSRAEAACI